MDRIQGPPLLLKITNTLRITIVLNDLDEEIRDKERLKIKSEIDLSDRAL